MNPELNAIDHLVLTVTDLETTLAFYSVLGMTPDSFEPPDGTKRWALKFGHQKINLHLAGHEFEPKAHSPKPGSTDICFLSDTALAQWQTHLSDHGVAIEQGPATRTGATGPIISLYIRDPDQNLIEISNHAE